MGRVIAKRALQRHPEGQSSALTISTKSMFVGTDVLRIEYHLEGDLTKVVLPQRAFEQLTDRLWDQTCFEAFLMDATGGYTEVNLSPSSAWATYQFEGYREGMQQAWLAPYIHIETSLNRFSLTSYLEMRALPHPPTGLALSAVIEETDGTKSYWALRHPPGAPDFHHPDCFALTLEAPPLA